MTDTFDRTQLDGKDREQLSEIASALGVKAISRMRKADLVEAIVSATSGSNGSSSTTSGATESRPRKIRSTVSGGDDLASLAAEEDALATGSEPADEMTLIRPRRSGSGNGSGEASAATVAPAPSSESTQVRDAQPSDNVPPRWAHDQGHEPGIESRPGLRPRPRIAVVPGSRRRRRPGQPPAPAPAGPRTGASRR